MKTSPPLLALLAGGAILAASGSATANDDPLAALDYLASEVLQDWHISGDVTARFDFFEALGDDSASVFPDLGSQYYLESFVNFRRNISPFETVSGFFGGLYNRSDYRTFEHGLLIERFRTEWEKGDSAVPFRATAGDYFGFLSPRSLQRTLKGGQIELQPELGLGDNAVSSVLLFSGLNAPIYRDLSDDQDIFTGASLLHDDPNIGAFIFNVVHNYKEAGAVTPAQEQIVSSLAGEIPFTIGDQNLSFESELGYLHGEHALSAGEARDGLGLFAELRGRSQDAPLDYSLLYERYDENYRPGGGIIAPDRESSELQAGWRFDDGLRLRGRAQRFVDGLDSGNPVESYVAGLNLTGPIENDLIPDLSIQADSFGRWVDDEDGLREETSGTASVNLTAPVTDSLTGRFGSFLQLVDNEVTGAQLHTYQATLGADQLFEIDGLDGVVSPGLLGRLRRGGGTDSNEIGPSIAFSLFGEGHELRGDYRMLFQNRTSTPSTDVITHDANLAYSYTYGPHRIGLDATMSTRDPDSAASTESFRIGAFYTFSFDHAPQPARGPEPFAEPTTTAVAPLAPAAPEADLLLLRPGLPLANALKRMALIGAGRPSQQAGVLVYEYPYLDTASERQRIALVSRDGRLQRSAVIIDFNDVGRPDTIERTFERIREAIFSLYGPPQSSLREGDFSVTLADDLNSGRFIRIDEWRIDQRILRFGIPRRLDRQVRMELHFAHRYPASRTAAWGIEEVR